MMRTCLAVLAIAVLSCSSSSPSEDAPRRPRRGHGPEDVPAGEEGPHALPVGEPVAMPHGGGMPHDSIHGGGGGGGEEPAAGGGGGGGDLQWTAPDGWRSVTPSSSMRVAEWALAKSDGDADDASLVVFHFPGTGGSVQANLDRWYGQFEQPDGRATGDVAQVTTRDVASLHVTITDVTGTFAGGGMMGGPPSAPKPDYRMLAAIVETPAGPWFFKLTGPKRTVEHWRASFDAFVASLHM